MTSSYSLRGRLLWLLLGAVLLTAAVQAGLAYQTALEQADQIFDYQMVQMAASLRSGLPVGETKVGESPQEEENDDFVVQLWSADGVLIFQSAAGGLLPRPTTLGFSNLRMHGKTYRVFFERSKPQTILVAQDIAARHVMAGTLALRTVAPGAFMAPLLMLIVWGVISRSMLPVARVRRQVAERQADDLTPVSETALPDEVRPLVQELNLLLARVRRAFEAQQHFVADAAHELRTPLAALKLQALGLQRAVGDEARDLAVSRLTAGIDRATRLVDQLLVLARQEAGIASGSQAQSVVLADVVRRVMAEAAAGAQERRIDIGARPMTEASVRGHEEALGIMVRNLLDNAIKYTPAGGRVDVEVRAEEGQIALVIEDSGSGISAEDRERVFDRFYRVGRSQGTGSGLGLAIVKAVAELHRATLALDVSPSLGGSRVTVRFQNPS